MDINIKLFDFFNYFLQKLHFYDFKSNNKKNNFPHSTVLVSPKSTPNTRFIPTPIPHVQTAHDTEIKRSQLRIDKAEKIKQQLTRFHQLLKNTTLSQQQLLKEFDKLPQKIKDFLSLCIWVAHDKPQGDPLYGQHQIENNVRVLLDAKNNKDHNLVQQLITHFNTRSNTDQKILSLQKFSSILAGKPDNHKVTKAFQQLDTSVREMLCQQQLTNKNSRNSNGSANHAFLNAISSSKKNKINQTTIQQVVEKLQSQTRKRISEAKQRLIHQSEQNPLSISSDRLLKNLSPEGLKKPIRSLFIAVESNPIIKQGGLAEAVHGLAEGLAKQNGNNKVTIILPKYDILPENIKSQLVEKPKLAVIDPIHSKVNKVFQAKIKDVKFLFIEDTPANGSQDHFKIGLDAQGKTASIYGPNEQMAKDRFAYFSSVAAELAFKLKNKTDVIHLHDWHVAPVSNLLPRRHQKEWKNGQIPPVVFTFHNNNRAAQGMYQGPEGVNSLKEIGIYDGELNAFVQALLDSDAITTVSETFAKEAQSQTLGAGIENEVKKAVSKNKVTGILNGSNPSAWNPETDSQLKYWKDPITGKQIDLTYGPKDNLVAKKKLIKEQLQKWLSKYRPDVQIDFNKPLVTYIGRFDSYQKGLDMLSPAMHSTINNGGQFIAMGSQEDSRATHILNELEHQAKQTRGAFIIRDNKGPDGRFYYQQGSQGSQGIGSLIRAASEFVLVPSEFEPCGLVQFEGWLFGSLAIGTKTGGLADSINTEGPHFNGFLFNRQSDWHSEKQKADVYDTVKKSLNHWKSYSSKEKNQLMKRLMEQGRQSSWTTAPQGISPVEKYRYVYAAAQNQAKWRGSSLIDTTLLA